MNSDTILWITASVAEAAVIGLLLFRHIWRSFPVFFAYSVWTLAGSAVDFIVYRSYPSSYVTAYMGVMILDSILLFGVLVELGLSIVRPLRATLPRITPIAIGVFVLVLGAIIWPFAAVPQAESLPRQVMGLMHLQQTFSILRVLVFLVLAGCSQLLSIGWRNRELQIATGLGFTSLVGLTVAMLHTHQTTWAQYSNWSELVVAGYLCSLLYWIVSFAQQEQERRAFTPQMENMLLAMAGAARTARVALEETSPRGGRGRNP